MEPPQIKSREYFFIYGGNGDCYATDGIFGTKLTESGAIYRVSRFYYFQFFILSSSLLMMVFFSPVTRRIRRSVDSNSQALLGCSLKLIGPK